MKVSNTEGATTSPGAPASGKKLRQARLPFQAISTATPHVQHKRKLSPTSSPPQDETPKKIIKVVSEELDESPPSSQQQTEEKEVSPKQLNPLVSLVDTALKRKLSKRKSPPQKKKGVVGKGRKSKRAPVLQTEHKDVVECNETEINKSKNDDNKKLDNKENINQVILIEDSCDVPTTQTETTREQLRDEEIKAKDDETKSDKNNINSQETKKSLKSSKKRSRVSNKKIISSMKDEGIVELSDDSDDETKTETVVENDADKSNKKDSVVASSEDEISNCESGKDISENETDNINNESNVEDEVEEKMDVSPLESDVDDEHDTAETSALDVSVMSASECEEGNEKNDLSDSVSDKNLTTPKSKRLTPGDKASGSPQTSAEQKKLTPKQLQKKLESVKKQQEREKEKQERFRKRQEEKEERNKQRLEKEEQKKKEREEKEELKKKEREERERLKDQEKKEREEKEEAKRKEREEKEHQKKREKEAKEEERRKKELEREEDKRKKELEKEEAQLKKKKASVAFVNFFVPKASGSKQTEQSEPVIKHNHLSNFTIKADMRLAPLRRKTLSDDQKCCLDEILKTQKTDKTDLFVSQLKNKSYDVGCSTGTWPLEEDDVMIVEDELLMDSVDFVPEEIHKRKMRAKLLSFSDNRRPPYWGTWRRKSKHITGRKPFGMDSNILDYECDSDDEWEEEEPGESVGGSVAGSDDEEEENDYEVDNDFMVPHGYLSEEEAMGDEDEILSPESQKAKLKIMQCEFEKEMKKHTEKLHPRSIGIIWQTSDGGKPDSCKDSLWDFLINKRILTEEDHVRIHPKQVVDECAPEETKNEKPVKKSRKITEDMTPELIKLVHGNTNNRGFLAHEFQTYLAKSHKEQNENNTDDYVNVSKMSIAKMIKEIAKWRSCPIEGLMFGKMCWCVHMEVLEKCDIKVDLPNRWNYVLSTKKRSNITPITQFLNPDQANT